jgi:carboxyl-terminal processing protease
MKKLLKTGIEMVRFFTEQKHRVVYGGGGIKPDIITPYETNRFAGELYELLSSPILNNTIYEYFSRHSKEMSVYKTFRQFDASFSVTPQLMSDLKANFQPEFGKQVSKVWSDARAMDVLRTRIKALLARMLFRSSGYYQEINKDDNVIQRSLNILRSREYSAIVGG